MSPSASVAGGRSNAVALGTSSSAAFANSTAIGAGAVTTQANQVAIGTAASTYTLPGITSAASLAAQVGPTSVVTTDAAGNLAATPFSGLATSASVAALGAQVNGLASAYRTSVRTDRQPQRGAPWHCRGGGECTWSCLPRRDVRWFPRKWPAIVVGRCGLHGRASTRHRIPAVIFGSYSNGGGREHILSGGADMEF